MQSDAARIAGCHQTTVGDALFAFVRALNRRAGQFIFWPREGEKIEIRRKFYTKFGLPGVDWCHRRHSLPNTADLPKEKRTLCVERVTTVLTLARWVCSKWPGSAHDSRVFKTSILYDQLKKGELEGVLLGDSAYASETFLLKPLDSPRNLQEEGYNRAVCSARTRVEQAFGVLKRQFHILHGECRYSPSKAAEIVVACCVLRNIAIGANEPSDYDEYTGELRQDGEVPSEPSTEAPDSRAISFMRDIISVTFERNGITELYAPREQAFGVLKRQFHILHGECRYSPSKAAEIVVACCVLRNIAIGANEPSDDDENDYDEYTGELRQDGEVPSEPSTEAPDSRAISFMRDFSVTFESVDQTPMALMSSVRRLMNLLLA
ncbi:hypothetical protein OSTOST_06159 [Ostertagia ostertagi]